AAKLDIPSLLNYPLAKPAVPLQIMRNQKYENIHLSPIVLLFFCWNAPHAADDDGAGTGRHRNQN
ncbi:MAG: hypothetical protein LBD30_00890, partial [Verrucomicrobiales bacterium]|nr:hypothetical protein [Verrucomicrobiales bacterium]